MFFFSVCFSSFYPGFSATKWSSGSVRYSYSVGNHWVSDSVFLELVNTDNGGAIMINQNSECRILISSSMFYRCRTSLAGGGIYVNCINGGNSVLSRICSNGCQASHNNGNSFPYCGQFCFLYTNAMNHVFDTTVAESVSINPTDRTVIVLSGGNQRFDMVNLSRNKVWYDSLVVVASDITRSDYCTFTNEHPTDSIIVHFYTGTDSKMSHSNIVNNTVTLNSYGHCVQYSTGNSEMFECVFLNNQNGRLFLQRDGKLTINDCWIQSGYSNSNALILNPKTGSSTFSIIHFSTFYCLNAFKKETKQIDLKRFQNIVFLSYLLH